MRSQTVVLSFLFTLVTLLGPSSGFAALSCSAVFADAPVSPQIAQYEKDFSYAANKNARLYAVLKSFLEDAKNQDLILPDDLLTGSETQLAANKKIARQWIKLATKEALNVKDLQVPSKNIKFLGRAASDVYLVTLKSGENVIFRPGTEKVVNPTGGRFENTDGGNITIIRKTLLAFKINRWFKMKSVPESWLGTLNGQVGLFSEFIPYDISESEWSYEVKKGTNPKLTQFYDLEAFEFLIGNYEADWAFNIRTRTANERAASPSQMVPPLAEIDPVIIDHDPAFTPGITYKSLGYSAGPGSALPMRYTPTFVENLKSLTPDVLIHLMGPNATESEIRGVLFRRALMLRDLELSKD